MKMNKNIILMADSYKQCHHAMYPEGTEYVYSYFEARKGAKWDNVVFFGLQYLLKEYLEGEVVTMEKINFAEDMMKYHFGDKSLFKRERWEYILKKYNGKLPIKIKAVPEGTPVPINNVLMTVENTDPNCYWLTNHVETLLTWVWYPSTVATLSRETKKLIKKYLEETATTLDGLLFKLHDFGYRGVSGREAAAMGGAGHLVNFMGTDTIAAMEFAYTYYNAKFDTLAFSVPATEHSIQTSLGPNGELDVYRQLLKNYPTGILSIVSDSYDIYRSVEKYLGEELKEEVLNRDGIVVVRPDSGDPVKTVLKLITILGKQFGYEVNKKGYRELNPKVRLIWGDGIDINGIGEILEALKLAKWSSDNIVFGEGGCLLQKVNRDTQRFAFKCSAQRRNNKWYDIYKDPIDKSKKSKRGKLVLVKHHNTYNTYNVGDYIEQGVQVKEDIDILETVFQNGKIQKEYTFEEIRKNAELI